MTQWGLDLTSNAVHVYTDGACRGNPGPGGWGVSLRYNGTVKNFFGAETESTNNRMELMAAIMALESLTRPCTIKLHTDSKYVLEGITKWMKDWKKRGWKTAARKPVKNKDLWQALDEAVTRHDIEWKWVKGHDGNEGNEEADALANLGVDEL